MQSKWYLIAAGVVTAFAIADDIETHVRSAKFIRLATDAYDEVKATRNIYEKQLQYLCSVLNKHGVPMDEFDSIALNDLLNDQ